VVGALLLKGKKQPSCYHECYGLFALLQQVVIRAPAGGKKMWNERNKTNSEEEKS